MKWRTVGILAVMASGLSSLAQPALEDTAVATDPTNKIRCSLLLTTNHDSHCASGVSITLENLSLTEMFSFEVSKNIHDTFLVSIHRPQSTNEGYSKSAAGGIAAVMERTRISKPMKMYSHREPPPEHNTVRIPPESSITWPFQFAEIVDPTKVTDKMLTNCFVHVCTVTHRIPVPAKLLSTYKTNVCISLP